MPTVITHALLGAGAGATWLPRHVPRRFWVLSIILPVLPDADVLAFAFGLPYDHFFGHRGFFHSIPFAFVLSLIVVLLFFRSERLRTVRWWGLLAYFFVITASHGVLDAFTSGGEGIALLSPFDDTRFFFGYRPIEVSPIGVRAFFSEWGMRVIVSEMLWLWLPAGLVLAVAATVRRVAARSRS